MCSCCVFPYAAPPSLAEPEFLKRSIYINIYRILKSVLFVNVHMCIVGALFYNALVALVTSHSAFIIQDTSTV